ncbi:MAG: hypothetical protein H3C34_24800, partial [Caldilineaceae bacterium]|nr:hypothetical protein [Caldilineaceae bacterium]
LGALGGQMYWDSATVDLRVLGGGWVKSQGKDKLATLDCLDSAFDRCEDAPAVPVQFRLTRRGDVWRTYRWVDGTGWTLTSQQQLAAPETLWIGWVFKRAASDGLHDAPAISTLRNVRVVNAPLGAMAPPAWDLMEPAGTEVLKNGVRLALDGTHTGTVEAQAGQQLEGDFDVVVRVEIPVWTRQPGETRVLGVAAVAMDNQSRAYVAFSETETRRIFNSDMQINNGWYRWREVSSDESPATWLRITRIDDRVTTAYWGGCKWRPFQEFADPFPYPVFVRPFAGNEWEATAPAAVAATFTIEHMAQGAATRELAPWEPAGCSVITAADLPPTLVLPAGVSAAAWTAPLTLGRVFFDDQGMAYVFSNDLIKRHLLSVGADGVARYWMESDLVAGLNRKSGVWNGASLLVAIDYWPEGGNPFSGIQELASDGSVRAWETVTSFGGVTDMLPAPDGGWLLADFEQDNVFYLPAEGAAALPLITEGERPAGLWALAAGASSGTLYALNRSGDPPYGGVAGIYQITDTGEARLVAQPPEGAANFGGIAVADGRVFARGLYATVPDGNQVVRVRESGTLEPVLEDIPAPRELAFDPLTGDLMVVYAGNMLLRVTAVSAPAVTPPEAPAQSGPPPPSPAPLAAVIHILEIEAPAQTAAGEMFGITVRYGWDVGAAATVGIRAEGGAATRDAPGSPASVTGRGEATASLAIFAPDVAGPHTFAVEAYALLANGSEQIDRRRVTVNLVAAPAPIPDPQAVPPADPAAQPPPDPAGDATTKVVATPESVPLATPALAAIPTLAPTPTFAPTPTPTAPATAFQPVSDAVNVFFTIRTDGSPWAYVVDKQGREVYPQAGVPVVAAEVRPGDLLVLHTDARAFSLLFDCGVNPRSFSPCDFAAAAPGELPAQIWVNDGSDSAYLNLSGPDNWGDLRPNFAGQRYPADPVFRVVIRK